MSKGKFGILKYTCQMLLVWGKLLKPHTLVNYNNNNSNASKQLLLPAANCVNKWFGASMGVVLFDANSRRTDSKFCN